MRSGGRRSLTLGAFFMALVCLFHVVCAVVGPPAYRYFSGETMAKAASDGPWLTILTAGLAVMFGIFALYALSAAGRVRPLPLTRVVIAAVGVIFTLRGIALVPESFALLRGTASVPVRNLVYSGGALLIGVLYLLGLAQNRRRASADAPAQQEGAAE